MRVLVAYATYYGATREIASTICQVLNDNGVSATLRSLDDAVSAGGFDAFVVGSSVHAGHWLKPAAEFVARNEAVLAKSPVWLFSSGPVGDAADRPQPDPKDVTKLRTRIKVRNHVVFGGAFDRASTAHAGWLERTVGRFIPEGDFRDWPEIEAWARGIARELTPGTPEPTDSATSQELVGNAESLI